MTSPISRLLWTRLLCCYCNFSKSTNASKLRQIRKWTMFCNDCIERKIFFLESIIFELEDILNLNLYKISQGCIFAKYCFTKIYIYKNISWNFNIWLAEAEMMSWAPPGIQPTFRENLWPRQGEETWQFIAALLTLTVKNKGEATVFVVENSSHLNNLLE